MCDFSPPDSTKAIHEAQDSNYEINFVRLTQCQVTLSFPFDRKVLIKLTKVLASINLRT